MSSIARGTIAAAACIAALGALGADKPCTKADAGAAEKSIDKVNNWEQLKRAYDDYHHCDSVQSVADIYTDAILRLAVDWKRVQVFADTMKDPQYRAFVYAHIKSPAAKDDREAVYSRAKASCPRGLDDFCSGLADVANPESDKAAPAAKQEMMQPIGTPK
jgi:hypothetical protein